MKINVTEQIEVLTSHKIRVYEEVQWWNNNLKQIDWVNESTLIVSDILRRCRKSFLDIGFPPNDESLGFSTSHCQLE